MRVRYSLLCKFRGISRLRFLGSQWRRRGFVMLVISDAEDTGDIRGRECNIMTAYLVVFLDAFEHMYLRCQQPL
jgi:hypothetical protein